MANWYCSSVAYTAVAQFAITHVYSVGDIIRQLATPTVGQERCFRCTTAGTSGGAESAWNLTKGSTTAQGTATFTEITGNETYQGTSWAAPFARMQTAVSGSWVAAGDTTFVSADHAETQATAMTLTGNGTLLNHCKWLCVARPSASIPPSVANLSTGATVTTTGANALTIAGPGTYVYGIAFNSGSGANSINLQVIDLANAIIFDRCQLNIPATGAAQRLILGRVNNPANSGNYVKLLNTSVSFGNANSGINVWCPTLWDGGSVTGTVPTNLLFPDVVTAGTPIIDVRNVDLSLIGAAAFLVNAANAQLPQACVTFTNCKLNALLGGVATGTYTAQENAKVDLVVSDSGTNVSREEHYRYGGSVIADTANYLTAGASDGTTHKSWKMVSNANCSWTSPLEAPDMFQWMTAGVHILTLYCANTSAVTLKDIEFGFEVEYMGSALTPQGTFSTTFPPVYSTGSNLLTTSVPWTGLASPTRQLVTTTITTAIAGWVRVRPVLKKASTTLWVDPLIAVS